jgi:hypothetical protein
MLIGRRCSACYIGLHVKRIPQLSRDLSFVFIAGQRPAFFLSVFPYRAEQ